MVSFHSYVTVYQAGYYWAMTFRRFRNGSSPEPRGLQWQRAITLLQCSIPGVGTVPEAFAAACSACATRWVQISSCKMT